MVMIDFSKTDYLKSGSQKPRDVFRVLITSSLMSELKEFTPVLAGTIPIGIDTAESEPEYEPILT